MAFLALKKYLFLKKNVDHSESDIYFNYYIKQ